MRVLVTGATGFIGSHIADELHKKGIDVVCNVRKTSNLRWLEGKGYKLIEASLSDTESLKKAVEDVDMIIHSAGLTAAKNYEGFLRANLEGTKNLFNAAYQNNGNLDKFVFISSLTAVGPSPSLENPIDESASFNPITSYGKSKMEAEKFLHEQMNKLPITIVRPPAVYGPRDVATFPVFKAASKGLGTLIGFDPKYVSLISSMDLTDGIVKAALSDKSVGETYFIGSEKFHNWPEIIDEIGKVAGKKNIMKLKIPHPIVKVIGAANGFIGNVRNKPQVFNYEKSFDFIQKYWICSIEKAKKELDYKQNYNLEEGFQETMDWYKKQGWM